MEKILACIDASTYATSICDHAAWAASRTAASVEVLHVIARSETSRPHVDMSGSIGLGASEALVEELTRGEEAQSRIAQRHGREMLDGAKLRLIEAGVREVMLTHRHGEVAETVTELEASADLVVIGKRGETHNLAQNHLGGQVERVVRGSIRPVLVVPRIFLPIRKVIIAFDGGATARKAVEFIASNSLFDDLDYHVIMAGADSAEARQQIAWAEQAMGRRSRTTFSLLSGHADVAIKNALGHMEGELLVMGAYGHSRIRELIVGSTTTTLVRTAKLPVLLFR